MVIFLIIFFHFFIEVQLLYNVSGMQQSESDIYVCMYVCVYIYIIFLGSKITADGDCCCEIIRRLFLGRKVMTNPDSI